MNLIFSSNVNSQKNASKVVRAKFFLDNNLTEKALHDIGSIKNKSDYAYLLEGKIHLKLNNSKKAVNAFKKANALNDHYADFELCKLYANLNLYDSACFYLEDHLLSSYKLMSNEIEQEPDLEAFRKTKYWQELWSKGFYNEEEKSIERAIYYKEKGELDLALDMLDEVLLKNKNSSQAMFYRAQFVVQLNEDYRYAISDLKKAVKLQPENNQYIRLLADYYLHELKYKKALESYKKANSLFPYLISDWYNLSKSYYRNNDFENAIQYIKSFLKIDIKNIEAHKLAGLIYYDSEKYEESIAILTKAIYINSRRADILFARGKSYLDNENYHKAGMDFNIALDLDSKNGEIWYYKALAFLYQEKKEEACKYFTKASYYHFYRADEYLLKECSD
jgi:tetratricopeptide (TPR) repeat protein